MARGKPIKQTLIGYTQIGAIKGKRQTWYTSITDLSLATRNAEDLGMVDPKLYPIYKDEN